MSEKKLKLSDEEQVRLYMSALKHPLKAEIEAVRNIIKSSSNEINERIKWNAPSYYYNKDLFTFNHRNEKVVHLVFHHPAIVTIDSPLLKGEYKDRRMIYFANMEDVEANKPELQRIIKVLFNIASNT